MQHLLNVMMVSDLYFRGQVLLTEDGQENPRQD